MDNTERLYKEITDAFGVPGYETEIRQVLTKSLEGLTDELTTDQEVPRSNRGRRILI